MTPPADPHDDDRRLQALFDRTAEQPTSAQITKLAARAADVPARARRFAWPAWILGPTLAAAAAVVLLLAWPSEPADVGKVAVPAAEAPAPRRSALPAVAANLELPTYDEIFPAAATAMFTNESDELDPLGGSLEGPTADDDLDAWLAAADEILGGG